ncbi:hypothetical protein [Leeuwenhoekiella blandensis]|uniref:hypothetical protein n=1 Tax=Leeuwenhoekiella blandensis TaxID=360293 RepID=UPI002355DEBA|nr:hypothetical protein [Leeuwenhoekiella blandensis]|tara:strand:+ start:12279 stop:12725 length:447 start_codon:yes stop_codon:yes gene_type:complete
MPRIAAVLVAFLMLSLSVGCKTVPALTTTKTTLPNAPQYTYIDTRGNTYNLSTQKLIYDPVSADNTIDGLDDEGRHLELNIELNDYTKMAAECERQFNTTQKELPANYSGYVTPTLTRKDSIETRSIDLSIKAVDELDYVIRPFLGDE